MVYETHRNHNHHHPQRVLQGIAWWCPCSSTYMNEKIMKGKRNSAKVRPKCIICMGALLGSMDTFDGLFVISMIIGNCLQTCINYFSFP